MIRFRDPLLVSEERSESGATTIARNKNQNTFAKRQREQDKKRKAEDKRARRDRRKSEPADASVPSIPRNPFDDDADGR